MCGRYSFSTSREKLQQQFPQVEAAEKLHTNYNVAPTQRSYVITDDQPQELQQFVWGLIPFWARDRKIGSRLINARSESIAEKPSFRAAVRKRRCWVLADSFYEWKTVNGNKEPYRIYHKSENLLVFAGIWEVWRKEADPVYSYSIITTTPNAEMARVHDRMPVVLADRDQQEAWLQTEHLDKALDLLHSPPDGTLTMYPISKQVNKVSNNGPQLHEPLGEQGDLFG